MSKWKGNKGEWAEPYVALRVIGDKKLYLANENGKQNLNVWMDILKLIRYEKKDRTVTYLYDDNDTKVIIEVNDNIIDKLPISEFEQFASVLCEEIIKNKASFTASKRIEAFLTKAGFTTIKAKSIDKSDVFFTLNDPRASIIRKNVGFSIKSEFGQPSTLFNTAKASAFEYELNGITKTQADLINSILTKDGKTDTVGRCQEIKKYCSKPTFIGTRVADRAKVKAFQENLDLINPRLLHLFEYILRRHFFDNRPVRRIPEVIDNIVNENPLKITRPEIKYPKMIKDFLYSSYSGMSASTLWDGKSKVNGGLIQVSKKGEVLAYYALDGDLFKQYLYEHCYFDYPSTDDQHGDYGSVYEENGKFYFRLNFQIRYK